MDGRRSRLDGHDHEDDMSGVDELAVVNAGTLRTGPPLTGAEPQRDALLRAHLGWLVVDDGNEPPNVDAVFCIAFELDDEVDL